MKLKNAKVVCASTGMRVFEDIDDEGYVCVCASAFGVATVESENIPRARIVFKHVYGKTDLGWINNCIGSVVNLYLECVHEVGDEIHCDTIIVR